MAALLGASQGANTTRRDAHSELGKKESKAETPEKAGAGGRHKHGGHAMIWVEEESGKSKQHASLLEETQRSS